MDRFDAVRIFIAVAAHKSFAEAGRQLRLSPSVITRSIAQLEDHLGVSLLSRTTRSVRLTERGEIYLQSCRQIIDDLEGADRKVRGENAVPRGELVVAAPIAFGRLHVLPIIHQIIRDNSALSVRLTLSDRNAHLVDDGIDVAVRIGELADSSLIAARLGAVSRLTAASPAYLQQRGTPKSPDDLASHDIIAFDSLDITNEWRFGSGATIIRVQPRLTVNSADAAVTAAEAGIGILRALSYQLRTSITAGRLIPILQDFSPPPYPVHAVYPARRNGSANVTAFVRAAREYFRTTPLSPVEDW